MARRVRGRSYAAGSDAALVLQLAGAGGCASPGGGWRNRWRVGHGRLPRCRNGNAACSIWAARSATARACCGGVATLPWAWTPRPATSRAQRAEPGGPYLVCDAAHVPLADRSFDGILCLDVLEHVTTERAVLAETARLLKPGGTLVLTVPQSGLLADLDSLNIFGRLVHATRRGRFPPEITATGCHHHYAVDDLAVDDLRALVSDAFTLVRVRRTGLGVAELVHLPALVLFRWLLRVEPLYAGAAFAYYTVYLLEDVVPLGQAGFHLLLVARRAETSRVAPIQPAPGHTQIDTAM
jgi:SAM-dependent methyltransferase